MFPRLTAVALGGCALALSGAALAAAQSADAAPRQTPPPARAAAAPGSAAPTPSVTVTVPGRGGVLVLGGTGEGGARATIAVPAGNARPASTPGSDDVTAVALFGAGGLVLAGGLLTAARRPR
jgi:hypothetical protein